MRSLLLLFLGFFSLVSNAQSLDEVFEELKNLDNDSIIRIKAEKALKIINEQDQDNYLGEAYYYLGKSYEESSPKNHSIILRRQINIWSYNRQT